MWRVRTLSLVLFVGVGAPMLFSRLCGRGRLPPFVFWRAVSAHHLGVLVRVVGIATSLPLRRNFTFIIPFTVCMRFSSFGVLDLT